MSFINFLEELSGELGQQPLSFPQEDFDFDAAFRRSTEILVEDKEGLPSTISKEAYSLEWPTKSFRNQRDLLSSAEQTQHSWRF